MEVAQFEEIQPEFMARVTRAIYCILTTVDGRGRPRSRVMHPIWEGPIGWVISWPQSHKATHLRRNPAVSLAYLPDRDRPVYVDGSAEWVGSAGERQRIWDLHRATPEPLGFDPEPYYGSIDHPYYGVLRIAPRRIELGNLGGEPQIWRPQPAP